MGFTANAQVSINCLYPFVPTPCQGWIDSSPNMVEVSTDCPTGYTLDIGDPVLISGTGSCPGATYTVTYTATDDCGSSASCSQTWVIENDGPTVECPRDLFLTCGDPKNDLYIEEWFASVNYEASCLLGSNTFNTYNPNWINGPCPGGFQTVTFFITDACGRSASCSATLFIYDPDAPVLEKPAEDLLEVCSANTEGDFRDWLNNHGGAIATDACSNVSWSTIPANPQLPLACEEVEVTFVASDGCGLEVSTTATFKLIDCHPPVITGQPSDMMVECTDDVDAALSNWLANYGGATADDACGEVFWMSDPMDPMLSDDCGNTGSVTVTFIAKDNCGNEALTNPATFTVVDNTPPVFTDVPSDMTIECVENIDPTAPEATDACGDVTVTTAKDLSLVVEGGFNGSQEVPPSGSTASGTARGTYNVGTGKLTLDVDFAGLSSNTLFAHIHEGVEGTNGPVVFNLPIEVGVTSGSFSYMVDLDPIQATSLEAGVYYINIHTEDVPSGEIRAQLFVKPCIGTCTFTWTATDDCGNTATASQMIYFEDTEAPVPSDMPADITISCGEPVVFADDPTWTDNCDTNIFTSIEDLTEDADCPNVEIYVRAWSAIDDCGNLGTTKQRIFVQDTEGPVFTFVPDDQVVDCPDDIQVTGEAEAEDACGGMVTITFEDDMTGSGCGMAMTRTWIATDECGNMTTATQTVTVNDNIPPVFTYVPPVVDITCALPPFDFEEPVAEDNCGNVTLTFVDEAPNGSICDEGAAYVRAYTATDDCGNTATVDVVYWVGPDEGAPEFTFVPEDLTFFCADGDPVFPDAVAVDDCDPDVVITFEDEFNTDPSDCGNGYGYDIIRTWTATDHCGNEVTAVTLAWVKGPLSFGNNNGFIENNGEAVAPNTLAIAPNPVDDNLNLIFNAEVAQKTNIRVFNILGKEVLRKVEQVNEGLNSTGLSVENFASGTYLISIELGDHIMTKKFIKR